MNQVLIIQYLAELDRIKKVSGSTCESVVREEFKDLLKGWGRQHDLVFVPEYELDTTTKDRRYVDGRPADARDDGERGDGEDRRRDAQRAAVTS